MQSWESRRPGEVGARSRPFVGAGEDNKGEIVARSSPPPPSPPRIHCSEISFHGLAGRVSRYHGVARDNVMCG